MVSESYKRLKQMSNDKIDKQGNEQIQYTNPLFIILMLILLLLFLINLF